MGICAPPQFAGIPVLAIFTVLFAVGAAIVLDRMIYGRSVSAIGQNMRASRTAPEDPSSRDVISTTSEIVDPRDERTRLRLGLTQDGRGAADLVVDRPRRRCASAG